MKYVKKQWERQIRKEHIKIQNSRVKTCDCGVKFIEIKDEIDEGYKRLKCPYCLPYKRFNRPFLIFKVWIEKYYDEYDEQVERLAKEQLWQ